MNLMADVARGGNSPFFGRMSAVVKDHAGNTVYTNQQVLAIYQNKMVVKFPVPLSDLRSGSYTADFKLESERTDIPGEDMIKIPTVEKSFAFRME